MYFDDFLFVCISGSVNAYHFMNIINFTVIHESDFRYILLASSTKLVLYSMIHCRMKWYHNHRRYTSIANYDLYTEEIPTTSPP